MVKVCMLTTAHSPYDVRIYHHETLSLTKSGFQVTIIAPWDRSEMTPEGVQIVAIKKQTTRLLRFSQTAAQVFKIAMSQRADVYHFHDPDLLPWMIALSIMGKRVVYDVHEYNSKSIMSKYWLPTRLRKMMAVGMEKFETFASARFSGVITVNPHMAGLFKPFNKLVQSVANYPMPWFVESCSRSKRAEPERVIYIGGLNKDRGYGLIFDAMKLVRQRRPNAECLIVGPVDYSDLNLNYPRLEKCGKSVQGVLWGGCVEVKEIGAYLLAGRIGWIPWQSTPNNELGTPIKLFEYMAAGLPMVVSRLKFITKIVEETGCGLLVPPLDPQAHADAICYLLDHPEVAKEMGERGRSAVLERYNWSVEENNLIAFYNRILLS